MCPALSSQLILGLCAIPFVNEMEGLRIVFILLWTWNSSLDSFPDTIHPPPPLDACINYLECVEVGLSPYEIVVGPNCIAQGLHIMLPHYSFIRVLLHCLLLFCSVCASSILLCSPQHVDLPLVMTNQCHDVTHVGRIHRDTMAFPFEVV